MSKPTSQKIIIVLGTTASGKTTLGVALARDFKGEIISADSRQVYKGMDLGTGKDLIEYGAIPYHLIDVISPKNSYNLARWLKSTYQKIAEIQKRGHLPIIVGGTALYLKALIENYQLAPENIDQNLRQELSSQPLSRLVTRLKRLDPLGATKIDLNNPRRVTRALEKLLTEPSDRAKTDQKSTAGQTTPSYEFLILGRTYPRETLRQRILQRLQERLEQGMVTEVANLHAQGVSWQKLDDFGLEYRFISRYLRGQLTEVEMREKLHIAICQFAKRQMTWFKKIPQTNWIKDYREAKKLVKNFLK